MLVVGDGQVLESFPLLTQGRVGLRQEVGRELTLAIELALKRKHAPEHPRSTVRAISGLGGIDQLQSRVVVHESRLLSPLGEVCGVISAVEINALKISMRRDEVRLGRLELLQESDRLTATACQK